MGAGLVLGSLFEGAQCFWVHVRCPCSLAREFMKPLATSLQSATEVKSVASTSIQPLGAGNPEGFICGAEGKANI